MEQMLIGVEQKTSWKGVTSLDEVKHLIDAGILLKWREMRTLKRNFSEEDQCEIIRHMTKRLCERCDERLSSEILVESLLIWMSNAGSDALIDAFIDQMFEEPGREGAARALVEVSLTTEVVDSGGHDEAMFATAVVLICELGLSIFDFNQKNPGQWVDAKKLLDHIATYLLSVSNCNNACIRLSLLHYFGVTSSSGSEKSSFNRVMSRFGHTVLDHLFGLLFCKRSEGIALRYLLDNLPYVLEADIHSQRILHETFKYYMLKQPERFALFLHTFIDFIISSDNAHKPHIHRVLLQHLGALLNVVSEVNHKILGKEIMVAIYKFQGNPYRDEMMDQIAMETSIRQSFKDLLKQIRSANSFAEVEGTTAKFGSSKRGRRPSFAKVDYMGTMDQVTYLGNFDTAKAS
ncbi:MAG: hypothetical protein R3B45_14615 [Bdellovibrionota bacterium]